MSTVAEIESAIEKLDPKEIRRVGDWLNELRERLFDERIEADAKAGELDKMIAKAKSDYRAGKARPFP
jgi:mRNA-degrading endonuclease RelE of RelBE toxin-antitoxin system